MRVRDSPLRASVVLSHLLSSACSWSLERTHGSFGSALVWKTLRQATYYLLFLRDILTCGHLGLERGPAERVPNYRQVAQGEAVTESMSEKLQINGIAEYRVVRMLLEESK